MSSRQLRKIQKQKELEKLQKSADPESESDEEEEPVAAPPRPRASLFAALGDAEEDDDDDDEAQKDADANHKAEQAEPKRPAAKGVDSEDSAAESRVAGTAKSKKKKKKKPKKKTAAEEAPTIHDDAAKEDGPDEIDRALEALNITPQTPAQAAASAQQRRDDSLLTINPYHLKAINEMRNLFGKDAIEAADQEEAADQQASRRRAQRRTPTQVDLETYLKGDPRHRLPEVALRRSYFVTAKNFWPRATTGGLAMTELGVTPDGRIEFAFTFGAQYDMVQAAFWEQVQLGDPSRMIALLKAVPYHVSTLLQVSAIAKQDQNQALAADLCERALFAFGRVTTSAFRARLEDGRAFLDFRRPENRQFWLSGYHYLKSLIRKGTYRTALEWTKLLFSLDRSDPYALKNWLGPLAVRSYEGKWFCDFCDGRWCAKDGADVYVRQTRALARLQLKDAEGARADVVAGMERLPWLYCALFQALDLEAPPPIWGVRPPTDEAEFWTQLYVHHAKDLWNTPQATALLSEAAGQAAKVDVKSLPKDPVCDLRTARLVFLEGDTGLLAHVPRALLGAQPNYEFDPLPPPREENIFSNASTQLPWTAGGGSAYAGLLAAARAAGAAPVPGQRVVMPEVNEDGDEIAWNFDEGRPGGGIEDSDGEEGNTRGNGDAEGGLLGGGFARTLRRWFFSHRDGGSGSEDEGRDGDRDRGEIPGTWPDEEPGYRRPTVEDDENSA